MLYSRDSYLSLPTESGVYRFLDSANHVLYVGKANDLKARVSSYFTSNDLGSKTQVLVSQIKKIKITIVESELEALLLEAFYIKKFTPKYNILQKDNKSYIRVRITIKDRYPAVLLARKEDDPRSLYFGPYPSSASVRLVLKTIRKVFPFQSTLNHPKKICLYNHLGLCPCPPVQDQFSNSQEFRNSYQRNIKGIIRILEGNSKKVMRELEKTRDSLSKNENFEEAQKIQLKINALSIITSPFHRPFEYDLNPNLRTDIRKKELNGLMEVLNNYQKFTRPSYSRFNRTPLTLEAKESRGELNGFNLTKLTRIECYDISNIQGTNATASMVVLTNGEIDKSQYRKFKIKTKGPNDFAMMQEVLTRRLNHPEWQFPDLIIVDGGKGQVSSALKVLHVNKIAIPLIGLAKKLETIVIPKGQTSNIDNGHLSFDIGHLSFKEVSLPKNSPSLHLIMRIRDEAHRFAITYHKKLRSKSALVH
jgi:excinuclease ABC subunit C